MIGSKDERGELSVNVRANIWTLYAVRFFYHLIPAYVIERLYWEERGMTIPMVVYTEILYAVTVVLLEIPSGILADKWGRTNLIVWASFLGALEFLILVFASEFWHFALVVILAGIGSSAVSGAGNALLYDTLLHDGREKDFEKILGRLRALDITAITLAALSGSFMAVRWGFEFNYWISFVAMTLSLCLAFLLTEPLRSGMFTEDESISIRTYVTASIGIFRQNPGIWLMVLCGIVMGASISFIDEFWQLYLDRMGIPVSWFGVFSATIFLLRVPGNILAYQLKTRWSERSFFAFATAVFAFGFLVMALEQRYVGLIAIFFICLISGIVEPLVTGYLHHRIDSSMRATVDSFRSLGAHAVLIGIGLGFGYFSTFLDVYGGYGFIAVVCGVFLVYFYFRSEHVVKQHG